MPFTLDVLNAANNSFWANKPHAMLWQSSSQSIPNSSTFTNIVTWDQSTSDNWFGHSASVNPSRYTAQVAGYYQVNCQVTYHNSAGLLVRALELQVNGTASNGTAAYNQSYSNNFTSVNVPGAILFMNVGDYVEANTWQNSGGAITLVSGACFMSVQFLHF